MDEIYQLNKKDLDLNADSAELDRLYKSYCEITTICVNSGDIIGAQAYAKIAQEIAQELASRY